MSLIFAKLRTLEHCSGDDMADEKDIISDVYDTAKSGGAEGLYDKWASDYDADTAAKGFRLPGIAAGFAARHIPLGSGPILDAGAGTGQVGSCLQILGYDQITGIDISEAMLAEALRTGAYEAVKRQVLGEELSFADNIFSGVICVGSFGVGHAPPSSLFELLRLTKPGSPFIFNVVENTWVEQGFPDVMDAIDAAGTWEFVEKSEAFCPYTNGEEDLLTRVFVYRAL
jgi:SAM-dependent methyltransferase